MGTLSYLEEGSQFLGVSFLSYNTKFSTIHQVCFIWMLYYCHMFEWNFAFVDAQVDGDLDMKAGLENNGCLVQTNVMQKTILKWGTAAKQGAQINAKNSLSVSPKKEIYIDTNHSLVHAVDHLSKNLCYLELQMFTRAQLTNLVYGMCMMKIPQSKIHKLTLEEEKLFQLWATIYLKDWLCLHENIFKYIIEISIYEGRLFVCLVLYLWDPLNPGCFRSCSWSLSKALDKEGCMGFGSMAFGLGVVQKFWNVELFLHWKLN
jgi:hypothetical protein